MILLELGGMVRKKRIEQIKRQENASEGLVKLADQVWTLHSYLPPFDPNFDTGPSGLQDYYPTICATSNSCQCFSLSEYGKLTHERQETHR
jgi:hypothetical protein